MSRPGNTESLHLVLGGIFLLLSLALLWIGFVRVDRYQSIVVSLWLAFAVLAYATIPFSFSGIRSFRALCIHAMHWLCLLFHAKAAIDILFIFGFLYTGLVLLFFLILGGLNLWAEGSPERKIYRYRKVLLYSLLAGACFIFVFTGPAFFFGTIVSGTLIFVSALLSLAYANDKS